MSRRPDYRIVISERMEGGRKPFYHQVGVAWETQSGKGYLIHLNPGVVLDWRMNETHHIGMYPNGYEGDQYEKRPNPFKTDEDPSFPSDDDAPDELEEDPPFA